MTGLSLTQPFASLMAIRAKKWETRGFRISKRHGQIAICSTAKMLKEYAKLLKTQPFKDAFEFHGGDPDNLPLGMVLAVGVPELTLSTRDWLRRHCQRDTPIPHKYEQEYTFGDYSPGRFATFFPKVIRLTNPVPCKGMQGLWPVSAELEALIRAQLPL